MTFGRFRAPALGVLLVMALGCPSKTQVPRYRCENVVLDQVPAPEGGTVAVVFERRCSPAIGYTTQVSLLGAGERLTDSPGNVFIASNGGRVSQGRSYVTVSWAGPGKLTVILPRRAPVYRLERRVAGVEIVYFARENVGADGAQGAPQPRPAR
jgi:hypothetical protein